MTQTIPTISNSFLIKQLLTPTLFINTNTEIVYTSDSWYTTFDRIPETTVGKKLFNVFINPSTAWINAITKTIEGDHNAKGKELFQNFKNEDCWFEWSTAPWLDDTEQHIGIIIQFQDITDTILKKENYNRLKAIKNETNLIARIGSWEFNKKEDAVYWCNMTKAIHEVTESYEEHPNSFYDFLANRKSKEKVKLAMEEAVQNKNSFRIKIKSITRNGKVIWLICSGKPMYKNKKFIGLIGIYQDITDIEIKEQNTRKNEQLLRTLIDHIPINIYMKDLESRKVLVNKAECAYSGMGMKDIIGKNDFEIHPPEVAAISMMEDIQVIQTKEPLLNKVLTSDNTQGKTTTFRYSKLPLINEQGEVYGIAGISIDITANKAKEAQMKNLLNVTAAQNERLMSFAQIVSHNLRSHSANFSMLLDFLIHEKEDETRYTLMNMMNEASNSLLHTLEDLNEITSISTNNGKTKELVSLGNCIKNLTIDKKRFLKVHQVKIKTSVAKSVLVTATPTYAENMIDHLITNAVLYKDPNRTPVIHISTTKEDHYTVLSISDNGLGIDLEKYGDKIFGMYKTFHENEHARGVGLYLTKSRIEAMGGKITVTSEIGKGSTFKLYFNDKY